MKFVNLNTCDGTRTFLWVRGALLPAEDVRDLMLVFLQEVQNVAANAELDRLSRAIHGVPSR